MEAKLDDGPLTMVIGGGGAWRGDNNKPVTLVLAATQYIIVGAATGQNQQNDMCTQRRLRSAWASAQTGQSSLSTRRNLGSLATH